MSIFFGIDIKEQGDGGVLQRKDGFPIFSPYFRLCEQPLYMEISGRPDDKDKNKSSDSLNYDILKGPLALRVSELVRMSSSQPISSLLDILTGFLKKWYAVIFSFQGTCKNVLCQFDWS